MNDRRRINPPSGGTAPPVLLSSLSSPEALQSQRPTRTRKPDELRKIFLRTGLNPSASGSAYLELALPNTTISQSFLGPSSSLKLVCSIHGPHPLPRSQPYTPHLHLTTHIKFAPFAARTRRGYVRDAQERDLAAHLETALRGVVIGERWPKSGLDVCVTVLEGEEDAWWGASLLASDNSAKEGEEGGGNWGTMTVLAGCVTVASAAIVDAGIDCVDLVSGGVAAVVAREGSKKAGKRKGRLENEENQALNMVLDPSPAEHERVVAAAMVAYLQSRDEITQLWIKGDAGINAEDLINGAVHAANASRVVLAAELREAGERKFGEAGENDVVKRVKSKAGDSKDTDMAG